MALYSAIRRVSKSTIPLAVRSVATAATSYFSAATATATAAVENSDLGSISRSFSIPVLHYSTSAVKKKKSKHSSFDDILLQIVDSEINFALDSDFHGCVSSCYLNAQIKYQISFSFCFCVVILACMRRVQVCIMFGLNFISYFNHFQFAIERIILMTLKEITMDNRRNICVLHC